MSRYHDDAAIPRLGTSAPGEYLIESRGGAFYLRGIESTARELAAILGATCYGTACNVIGDAYAAMTSDAKTGKAILVTRMDR